MRKIIIFDLDGTLLDTLKDLNEALNYTLAEFNFAKISLDKTRALVGNGIRKLIIDACNTDKYDACNTDKYIDSMFKCFIDYYNKNINVYTKPYDNIKELLYKLKDKGYALCVISNKNYVPLNILVDYYFKDIFDIVIGDGEGYLKKPNPDSILYCINKLNSNLSNTYYIGDSDIDIKTVNNAKCNGVFVSYGFRDKEKLVEAGAKIILDSVDALTNYLLNV